MTAYTEKLIDVELIYSDTKEKILLQGFRVNVSAVPGLNGFDSMMQCTIEGLSREKMYRLTAIGFIKPDNIFNQITIFAGDAENMETAFKGTISQAYIDASYQPDIVFNIVAYGATVEALNTPTATSYKGTVKVADVFKSLAAESNGLAFENVNVDKQIEDIYLAGSTLDKIRRFARYTNINFSIHNRILSIWDRTKTLPSQSIITVSPNSPDATMLRYPSVSGTMLEIDVLFTSKLTYSQTINLESDLDIVNGKWAIRKITHNLQSKDPGGVWFTHLSCDNAVMQ
jgi:hypothetical protein